MLMDVWSDHDLGFVHKRAQTAEECRRLGQEAAVLRAVAHPGVVQLVDVEGTEPPTGLILRRVPGPVLTSVDLSTVEIVAGLGAALATTVADLHDLGVSHGAIEAAHVVLDQEGRPVLCGFGHAARTNQPGRADVLRREDVRALARLLLASLPAGAPARAVRALRVVVGPGRPHRGRDARWLAEQLVVAVPNARLPTGSDALGDPAAPDPPRQAARGVARRSRLHPVPVAGLALLGLLGALVAAQAARAPARPERPHPVASACPAIDDGCGPIPTPSGTLTTATGRYQVGGPGDVVVVGRWWCGSTALPAVLRPATGQVWMWAAWPGPARPEPGRLAAQVPAASTLLVQPEPSGCDRLEVQRAGLPPLRVAARRG
jgi:hypothetical protein